MGTTALEPATLPCPKHDFRVRHMRCSCRQEFQHLVRMKCNEQLVSSVALCSNADYMLPQPCRQPATGPCIMHTSPASKATSLPCRPEVALPLPCVTFSTMRRRMLPASNLKMHPVTAHLQTTTLLMLQQSAHSYLFSASQPQLHTCLMSTAG